MKSNTYTPQLTNWHVVSLLFLFIALLGVNLQASCLSSSTDSFELKMALTGPTPYFDWGSTWEYFDLGYEPIDQGGLNWTDTAYDASSWSQGPAELGYGNYDESTMISSSALTAYFRINFSSQDPTFYQALVLDLLYDDGAVVYLNGVEVWRINMPSGTIGYDTFAVSDVGNNAEADKWILADLIVEGQNTIAVEVHQHSSTSDDLSFDFGISYVPPELVELERRPYLQKVHPEGVTIKWQTYPPSCSVVEFGLHIDSLNQIVVDSTKRYDHELEISNLLPNTRYYYNVGSEQGSLMYPHEHFYFQTSPPVGAESSIRAWILGDPGTGDNNARSVRNAYYNYVDSQHTDMILFLGDNAYTDGTEAEYQTAFFNMYTYKFWNSVIWSTLGNHDGHSASSATQTGPYYNIFSFPTNAESGGLASGTEAYYSFDYGNVHFIILDSYDSDRSVGGPMYNWCLMDLQNTLADWIVAIWHHPAYSKGSHDSDTEGRLVTMRNNFLPILEDYGTDVVLSGHSHSYERSYFINGHYDISDSFNITENTVGVNGDGDGRVAGDGAYQKTYCEDQGAVYVTAGSSGKTSAGDLDHEAMFISVSELGSCVMEVEGSEMKFKFIRENGLVQDSFSIIKSDCDTTSFTYCSSISSTYADVEERPAGAIYQQSSDLEMVWGDSAIQKIGLIFDNIDIRRGSSIQSAYIQFMSDLDAADVSSDSCYLIIEGFDMDQAAIFSEDLFDVSSRINTTQKVSWQPEPWGVAGESGSKQRTPDLAPIIQEIINRPGFKQGNNMGLKITGIGKRSVVSYDEGSPGIPAELCIKYTNCFDELQIDTVDNSIALYSAHEAIVSDAIILPGTPINFTAGGNITLEPGFQVDLGREFDAFILGCVVR